MFYLRCLNHQKQKKLFILIIMEIMRDFTYVKDVCFEKNYFQKI